MRVGGPAERILAAHSSEELVEHARELWDDGEDWLLLGGGSNTVVHDDGYPGPVLLVRSTGISPIADEAAAAEGRVRLRVQAGHDWDHLVAATVERGLAGIEALSGIPGRAGAAPVQNIGAYGQELSDVLHSIEFLDRYLDEVIRIPAAELGLGYRDSDLKRGREGVVLSIDLLLTPTAEGDADGSAPIAYGQLAAALGAEIGDRAPLREVRNAVLKLRASKGMVLDPADHDTWSAGSFFTNPIVSERFARTLPADAPRFEIGDEDDAPAVTTFEELSLGMPLRVPEPTGERLVKLSAAWLIEQSGVRKGFRIPGSGAAISSKHTLAITNRGNATADEVAQLGRLVVQRVQQEFGVILQPEPNLYGLEL
ncbi:UDP-N-acetylmuramate dehydrogenase [Leucobacter sp. CSA2]|uniref:UDP-N-acetylenolpyruvoylglucosamine reductase n=1 Tax=Leucobacter edaphi TaxID=2796472 RepID=A0A934QEV4_9MICO|nr:UDP-N-acetylmuramate dehydrogenase [Leucobacter edaphi]MBK0422274.1 UDP-N-acetylmuramate dehydrogenase [Leucobacter edaphi]